MTDKKLTFVEWSEINESQYCGIYMADNLTCRKRKGHSGKHHHYPWLEGIQGYSGDGKANYSLGLEI